MNQTHSSPEVTGATIGAIILGLVGAIAAGYLSIFVLTDGVYAIFPAAIGAVVGGIIGGVAGFHLLSFFVRHRR